MISVINIHLTVFVTARLSLYFPGKCLTIIPTMLQCVPMICIWIFILNILIYLQRICYMHSITIRGYVQILIIGIYRSTM